MLEFILRDLTHFTAWSKTERCVLSVDPEDRKEQCSLGVLRLPTRYTLTTLTGLSKYYYGKALKYLHMISEWSPDPKDNSKTLINVWTTEKMPAVFSAPPPSSVCRPWLRDGTEDILVADSRDAGLASSFSQRFHLPGVK